METKKVKVAEQNAIITQLKQFASLGSDRQKVFYGDLPHRWDNKNWCMDYTVKLADIEKGLNKALNYGGWPQKYVYNLCNADEGDFDYPQALCLLQFILFGEEIYG